jgi:hypothetical protein
LNKLVFDIAKDQAPELIKPCPWTGFYTVHNLTVNRKIIAIFPAGAYRFIVKAWNDDDKKLLKVVVNAEMF